MKAMTLSFSESLTITNNQSFCRLAFWHHFYCFSSISVLVASAATIPSGLVITPSMITIRCEGHEVKRKGRLVIMEGVITNPDGSVAAEATSTLMLEKQ